MSEIPSRNSEDSSSSDVKKVIGIGFKSAISALPGGSFLHDLIKDRTDAIRESAQKKDEERLDAFFQDLLNAEEPMDESVANAMMDDRDFHSVLRACLVDIESEKVDAYAALAISIATGKISQQWRRHFILALRDMSAEELKCLRSAFVARKYDLIPNAGSSLRETDFLEKGAPGSYQNVMIGNLIAKGFVHDGKLSPTGVDFLRSCTKEQNLTPSAIGYQSWSGQHVAIVSYELGNSQATAQATALQDELRKYQIKSSIIAIIRNNLQQVRLFCTQAILLLGEEDKGLAEHSDALIQFSEGVPLMVLEVSTQSASLPEELKVAGVVKANQDSQYAELIDWLLQFRNINGRT